MSDDSTAEKATGPFAIPVDLGDYSIDEAYERGVRGGIASRDAEVADAEAVMLAIVDATSGPGDREPDVEAICKALEMPAVTRARIEVESLRKQLAEALATIAKVREWRDENQEHEVYEATDDEPEECTDECAWCVLDAILSGGN